MYIRALFDSEYKISSILQMVGRAGRPGFDTEGVAVIMTNATTSYLYENLTSTQETIESHLIESLPEVLNAEIACKQILNREDVDKWIASTFLYTRLRKSPQAYGYDSQGSDSCCSELSHITAQIIQQSLDTLNQAGMVSLDIGCGYETLVPGDVMAVYYLSLDTIQLISRGSSAIWNQENLLVALSSAKELQTPCRKSDKGKLKEMLMNPDTKKYLCAFIINKLLGECIEI